jgi:putative PIN family toxin of toxin-antitoxin system
MKLPSKAVFDCNVFLQAMLSTRGAAHACWQQVVSGRVTLFVSPYILAEIRGLPDHKSLRRFGKFTSERVERFIEELLEVGHLIPDPPASFVYARDPEDSHYVDLAVVTDAKLIVSNDNDLLDLMDDANREGQMLRSLHPTFRIFTPAQFLAVVE